MPVLFSLLFCWVFEIQLLMQIIINRVYVVAENKRTVIKVRWITAGIITAINIAVFCIWIPAHLNPPANELYGLPPPFSTILTSSQIPGNQQVLGSNIKGSHLYCRRCPELLVPSNCSAPPRSLSWIEEICPSCGIQCLAYGIISGHGCKAFPPLFFAVCLLLSVSRSC